MTDIDVDTDAEERRGKERKVKRKVPPGDCSETKGERAYGSRTPASVEIWNMNMMLPSSIWVGGPSLSYRLARHLFRWLGTNCYLISTARKQASRK